MLLPLLSDPWPSQADGRTWTDALYDEYGLRLEQRPAGETRTPAGLPAAGLIWAKDLLEAIVSAAKDF